MRKALAALAVTVALLGVSVPAQANDTPNTCGANGGGTVHLFDSGNLVRGSGYNPGLLVNINVDYTTQGPGYPDGETYLAQTIDSLGRFHQELFGVTNGTVNTGPAHLYITKYHDSATILCETTIQVSN